MKRLHLICNAHIDPMWLWEWEEGAAEAMATFRVAADLCEEYDGFVFNHNEAILYKWVGEYDPALFRRIQRLVKQGKWHIMGGWFVQPDCNMPSGESFVRQALIGRRYFSDKFGVRPTTAVNLDPFGHTRGLVQILKKSGYDSYLHCRPSPEQCPLPGDDYVWVGYDGSEIVAHRAPGYNSPRGLAHKKVKDWIEKHKDKPVGLVLWGVGNHGGGPSRTDLRNLTKLMEKRGNIKIVHSTPEAYFEELEKGSLPRHERDVNPFATGCYTSQIRMKQKHRLLENELFMTEKMLSSASVQGHLQYPRDEIHEAIYDLMLSEFHDILAGSSIQPVEEAGLRLLDHGLEIVSRLKSRAFFALSTGQRKAKEGEIPILVYNPHPHKIEAILECEFNLEDINWEDQFTNPIVYRGRKRIPCQAEKELSNISLDWRKRAVFRAELAPSQMNRFDCRFEVLPKKPVPKLKERNGRLTVETADLRCVVNCRTGLVDRYSVHGFEYLKRGAFIPLAIRDDEDSWGMIEKRYRRVAGGFKLMSRREGARFSGVRDRVLRSVRVIEDGEVRTVIEAVFQYGDSFICQTYKVPKLGSEIELDVRVFWNEKSKMLKLSIPTALYDGRYFGQVAYGVAELPCNGNEAVAQKWVAVVSEKAGKALTCINDCVYGSDFKDGEIRLSLLRSPGYSASSFAGRESIPQDRFSPRIDQGERVYRFWLNAGDLAERLKHIDREALVHNERPVALSCYPAGTGAKPKPLVTLGDNAVQMTAFKKAESSEDYIVRLFEPTGHARSTTIRFPAIGLTERVNLSAFEIKTFRLNVNAKTLAEVDLMET